MSRFSRLAAVPIATFALILAADAAAWWWATGRMVSEVAAWQAARTAEGRIVRMGPAERGGWPLRAELSLPSVTLATGEPGKPDAVAWQASQVRLVWAPWRPWSVDAVVDGEQAARFGAAPAVPIAADPLDIRIPLDAAGQAQGVTVRARELTAPVQGSPVTIGSVSLRLGQADAFLTAEAAMLPPGHLPFGGTIQSLSLHARSTGPLPPLQDLAAALAAWRDAGQHLLIDDLALRWGPLDLRGQASVGLDAAMQPEGSAAVQMTGFAEVIDALARSGAITRNDARVATTLLGLMARPGAGDVREADLPLTLKDRTLSVGAIPVLRLGVLAVP